MELDCAFKHPTFRQVYSDEIRRLQKMAELNVDLQPREQEETRAPIPDEGRALLGHLLFDSGVIGPPIDIFPCRRCGY